MDLDRAQLAALSTTLDDLTERLTSIADAGQQGGQADVAADLFEVERSLRAAARRLQGVLGRI